MITKRTVVLVIVLGALAAWIAAASTSGVRSARVVVSPPSAIDARGAALSAEIEKLHDRLRPTAVPQHTRNLFQFGSRAPEPSAAAPAPVQAAARPAPVEPPFKLIGMAEDAGVRTAILSSPSQLLMVKAGDLVAPTYRVSTISADAIELTDSTDGSVLRLALK